MYLGGEAFLDGLLGLVDEPFLAGADFVQVAGDEPRHGVAEGEAFHAARKPSLAAGVFERGLSLLARGGAVIEIRRVARVRGRAVFAYLHEMDVARDDAAAPVGKERAVLNGMLDVEEQARGFAGVAFVHQHGPALQKVAGAFAHHVDERFEQGMPGADEGGRHGPLHVAVCLVEADALVAVQHRLAVAHLHVAAPHGVGNEGDFPAAFLTRGHTAAQFAERLLEKGFDEMRLEAAGLHALHVLADDGHGFGVHHVLRERVILHQLAYGLAVEGLLHVGVEAGLHGGVTAVAHGFDEQFAQGAVVERDLAEYVEDLASQRLLLLLQFFKEFFEDLAFAGLGGDEVPEPAVLGLSYAVDSAEALFEAIWVPRQVIVHHEMCPLEVEAFACGVRSDEDAHVLVLLEAFLHLAALVAEHSAVDDHHGFLTAEERANLAGEVAERVAVFREDDELFA